MLPFKCYKGKSFDTWFYHIIKGKHIWTWFDGRWDQPISTRIAGPCEDWEEISKLEMVVVCGGFPW